MKPEIVEQDAETITVKLPNGERVKIARSALPKLVEHLEFELKRQGRVN